VYLQELLIAGWLWDHQLQRRHQTILENALAQQGVFIGRETVTFG
jgi:hypothetical protein